MRIIGFAIALVCLFAPCALGQPNSPPLDPYGESVPDSPAAELAQDGQSAVDAILADPSAAQQDLEKYGDLKETVLSIGKAASSERSAWLSRQVTSRARLVKALQKQLTMELSAMSATAKAEEAVDTVASIEAFSERFDRKMEYTATRTRQQRADAARASRASRGQEGTGPANARRSSRSRSRAAPGPQGPGIAPPPEKTPDDLEFENDVTQWLQAGAVDNGELCLAENQKILSEYGLIFRKAEEEQAEKSKVLVASLILMRNERVLSVQAALEKRRARAAQNSFTVDDGTGTRGRRSARRPSRY
ncbi:MAG: hypothetical protein IIC50_19045 [Planctomycetes bacterium]|nr:hypothetical protein [Planctomycetota bacterium]